MDETKKEQECVDLNECEKNEHNCHVLHGICLNTIGSFTCECDDGFQGTGLEGTTVENNLHSNAFISISRKFYWYAI